MLYLEDYLESECCSVETYYRRELRLLPLKCVLLPSSIAKAVSLALLAR